MDRQVSKRTVDIPSLNLCLNNVGFLVKKKGKAKKKMAREEKRLK